MSEKGTREEKIAALDRLVNSIGSHTIVKTVVANEIGKPFGVTFYGSNYKFDARNPKGPLWDFDDGVSSFDIAASIANAVGAKRESYMGRGFQFRSDCEVARDAIVNEEAS